MEINELNNLNVNNTALSDEISYNYDNSSTNRSAYSSTKKKAIGITTTLVALSAGGLSIANTFIKNLPSIDSVSHKLEGNELELSFKVTNSTSYTLNLHLYNNTLEEDVDVKTYEGGGEFTYTYTLIEDNSYTVNFVATNNLDYTNTIKTYFIK